MYTFLETLLYTVFIITIIYLGKHLNFLKIKYPEMTKANKTLFLVTYAGKPPSGEKVKDNLKQIVRLVSPNIE